ncbi:MAG: glycosyltransferase 87 family protein, partial [Candidatus Daviesbacteria bacterium]|nr:glycosyltransferase 87 family protein [Candidatus Daviesbacteria bacterium]
IGFFFRIILAQSLKQFTVYNDLLTFQAWGNILTENGLRNFYSGWSDYLPGYIYILGGLSVLHKFLVGHSITIPIEIFYKLPSMMTDMGNAIFIYLIVKKFNHQRIAFFTAIIYYLNPVFWANSTLWGQADSFLTFFLLSSFYYLLSGRYWLSAFLIGLGQIVKPIAILSIPIYLLFILSQKKSFKIIIIYLTIFIGVVITLFIPFNNSDNILKFIIERHSITASQYPYTSVNAFNFWSIVTRLWTPDNSMHWGVTLHTWGYILFGLLYLVLLLMIIKNRMIGNLSVLVSFTLMLCYFGMFILLTRMHERHLFYGLSYLSLLLPIMPVYGIILAIALFLVHLVNLYYPYSQATPNPLILSQNVIIFLSVISVFAFIYFLALFLSKYAKIK